MAFYHETFGNVDVAPTHVIGNHERSCGSPARHGSSVLTLPEAVNKRRFKGNDSLIVRETLAAMRAAAALLAEPPVSEEDTKDASPFTDNDDADSENTATIR